MKYLARVTSIKEWVVQNSELVIKSDRFDHWAECDTISEADELENMNTVARRIKMQWEDKKESV